MLTEILQLFEPTSLENLNRQAPLMNREDKKFIFSLAQLDHIIEECKKDYNILTINNISVFGYKTWYYDTEELSFYHHHHNSKGNRIKVRKRLYENSGITFIEVKEKTSKGKTFKHRILAASPDKEKDFIETLSGYPVDGLHNSITLSYNRITLLHKQKPEKVTLDTCLHYENNNKEYTYNNLVIAEVKAPKVASANFNQIVKKHGIRDGAISKYCLGIISLNNNIKHNNFKQLYLRILKLNKNGNV